jgi:hypothetical protein
VRASINILPVRVRLVITEHGTGMDHITSAPATHPVTQVGYKYCCVCQCRLKRMLLNVDNNMRANPVRFFCGLK